MAITPIEPTSKVKDPKASCAALSPSGYMNLPILFMIGAKMATYRIIDIKKPMAPKLNWMTLLNSVISLSFREPGTAWRRGLCLGDLVQFPAPGTPQPPVSIYPSGIDPATTIVADVPVRRTVQATAQVAVTFYNTLAGFVKVLNFHDSLLLSPFNLGAPRPVTLCRPGAGLG